MAEIARCVDEANEQSPSPDGDKLGLRMLEAMLFASASPLEEKELAARLPAGVDVADLLGRLQTSYAGRGVHLRRVGNAWAFRTAEDLAFLLRRDVTDQKKLSRAALETLAIIAYHQPATRAEIEEIRGVQISKGTLDVLLEAGWIRLRGRRRTLGRPVTFGTTPAFLDHFGLESIGDLPGLGDLKATGLMEAMPPIAGDAPEPSDDPRLRDDEDPLEFDFTLDGEADERHTPAEV